MYYDTWIYDITPILVAKENDIHTIFKCNIFFKRYDNLYLFNDEA